VLVLGLVGVVETDVDTEGARLAQRGEALL